VTRSLTNSNNFKERARKVVPHLTGTFSKSARSNVEGWNKTVERFGLDAKMYGYPIRMHTQCFDSNNKESLSMKSLLLQEMIKKGIFMSVLGTTFICYSHSKKDIGQKPQSLDEIQGQYIGLMKFQNNGIDKL
jgi:hypothetical protein